MGAKADQIAVVGAGLAGLAAARELARSGHGVTVFEARDRVGGRVWSQTLDTPFGAAVIERGAEFVLDGYSALRGWAAAGGLDLVETGMSYYVREVRDLEGVTPEQMAELGQRAAAGAAEAGPVSAGEILDSLGCAGPIGEALRARVEISTAVGVSEAAALALKHVASFEPLPSWRVGGGNELLPHAMALELGGGMRLGERVARVASLADGRVAVRTETGEATFDAAVVALPFAALRGADAVTPDLPDWKAEALGRVVQGHAAKLHLPLAALPPTSAVMSANGRYWTWTAREEGGAVAPVLNCFAGEKTHMARLRLGEGARFWAEDARQLRPDLAFAAGAPVLTDWPADPLTGGGYTAHSPAFRPEDAAALEAPVGRVYFAGEYCDPDFTGLMEGALRSGARAARALSSAAVPA